MIMKKFIHSWDGAVQCTKCKKNIPFNSFHYNNEDKIVLCDFCMEMLNDDFELCLKRFLGIEHDENPGCITNDECIKFLYKNDK
jgi:hypothetical protein